MICHRRVWIDKVQHRYDIVQPVGMAGLTMEIILAAFSPSDRNQDRILVLLWR